MDLRVNISLDEALDLQAGTFLPACLEPNETGLKTNLYPKRDGPKN